MEDESPEITVPDHAAISGFNEYDPRPDEPYYAKSMNKGGDSWVATSPYCPVCSKLLVYDRSSNSMKMKWTISKHDYCFDLKYKIDPDSEETYVVCNQCRYDFRDDSEVAREKYGKSKKSGAPKRNITKKSRFETDNILSANTEYIRNGSFEDGYFLMSVEEFKRIVSKSYETKGGIVPLLSYGGTNYTITIPQMITFWKEVTHDEIVYVGVPRIYWKQTAL